MFALTSVNNYRFRLVRYVLYTIFRICDQENAGVHIEKEQAQERGCFGRWEKGLGIPKSGANVFNNPENHAMWSYRVLQDQRVNIIAKINKDRCMELLEIMLLPNSGQA